MNDRERYVAALTFQKSDRVPFMPGDGRRSTIATWLKQGLPAEQAKRYHAYIRELLDLPPADPAPPRAIQPNIVTAMLPEFEEKVLEERPTSRVVQDWKGNVCEIGREFGPSDLRGAPDFCTRSWIKCPVESRADWDDMKHRYNAEDPARFPDDFALRGKRLRDRRQAVGLTFSGPFWQLREWVGFENLCVLFLDDPDFAQDMVDFWMTYISRMLEKTLAHFQPDYIMINEDMAYKEKPMIGPAMCRRFLLPCWRQWGQIVRDAGVKIYGIDSDGHIGQLIPVWLEAGVNLTSPLEVAAGNDLPAYRQQYGCQIAYSGGVDKRAMAAGGDVIRREIDRLRSTVEAGGYIPSCDHGVPADVSWPNFVAYCRLLAQMTGWCK